MAFIFPKPEYRNNLFFLFTFFITKFGSSHYIFSFRGEVKMRKKIIIINQEYKEIVNLPQSA